MTHGYFTIRVDSRENLSSISALQIDSINNAHNTRIHRSFLHRQRNDRFTRSDVKDRLARSCPNGIDCDDRSSLRLPPGIHRLDELKLKTIQLLVFPRRPDGADDFSEVH